MTLSTQSDEKTIIINERRKFLQKELPARITAAIAAAKVLPDFINTFRDLLQKGLSLEIEKTLLSTGFSRLEIDQKLQLTTQDKSDCETQLKELNREVSKIEREFNAAKRIASAALEKLKTQLANTDLYNNEEDSQTDQPIISADHSETQ